MQTLGIKEAAEAIRHAALTTDSKPLPPEEVHRVRFLQGVATTLGLDHAPETLSRIAMLLHEHGIELHTGFEYPKHVKRKWDGSDHIVHSAEEEEAVVNEPRPEPVVDEAQEDQTSGHADDRDAGVAEDDGDGDDAAEANDASSSAGSAGGNIAEENRQQPATAKPAEPKPPKPPKRPQ